MECHRLLWDFCKILMGFLWDFMELYEFLWVFMGIDWDLMGIIHNEGDLGDFMGVWKAMVQMKFNIAATVLFIARKNFPSSFSMF